MRQPSFTLGRRLRVAAIVTALVLPLLPIGAARVAAAATTYYVNNQSGSNCSNAGSGTSQSQPWCDISQVTNHGAFVAGDQILLAHGAVWTIAAPDTAGMAPTG